MAVTQSQISGKSFHPNMFPIYNLLVYFYILLQYSSYAQHELGGEKGFSLEVIHIDSKLSPFYNANISNSQRISRSINRSKSYVRWLESTMMMMMTHKADLTVIRTPLHAMPPATFMVAVGIGSGNGLRNYYLHMDTGSGLTWTQCLPCRTGFPQSAPKFDPRLSATYKIVGCDEPICKPPLYKCVNNNNRCEYNIRYVDNTFIKGVLSRETFSFQDANASHRVAGVPHLILGCTHSSNMKYHKIIAGIFSMSQSPTSTVKQLAMQTDGLFSYCFFPPETAHASFLRFGHDIKTPQGGFQTTRILAYPNREAYYLDVEDISLNGGRMQLPRGTFTRQSDGTSSFLIDSGASTTHLVTSALDRVEDVMKDYFRLRLNLHPIIINDSSIPFRLCYKTMHGIEHELPTMTLNLRDGANYHIQQSGLFVNFSRKHIFCFGIIPSNDLSALGAKQQFNTWMRFDTVHNMLAFAPHDCLTN